MITQDENQRLIHLKNEVIKFMQFLRENSDFVGTDLQDDNMLRELIGAFSELNILALTLMKRIEKEASK